MFFFLVFFGHLLGFFMQVREMFATKNWMLRFLSCGEVCEISVLAMAMWW